jgi:hypothetical protein
MFKSGRLSAVITGLAFAMGFVGITSSAQAGGNCQAKLVGKSYDCNEKYSYSTADTGCYEFVTGGISDNFDLIIDGGADYGCACDTKGSFKSPSFDSSSSAFGCISTDIGYLINGKIKDKKKITGQGIDESGDSVIISCEVRATPCF